jgi:hypothetical protein
MRNRLLVWVLAAAALGVSPVVCAQASSVGVIVCGPANQSGVVYLTSSGRVLSCGTDANGNALEPQVSQVPLSSLAASDAPVDGGEKVGADIGAAVLLIMGSAFGWRVLSNQINSSSES